LRFSHIAAKLIVFIINYKYRDVKRNDSQKKPHIWCGVKDSFFFMIGAMSLKPIRFMAGLQIRLAGRKRFNAHKRDANKGIN
jgi:hypothetical protein